MGKTHVIDGKTYVEVEREAKAGDKIVIAEDAYGLRKGDIHSVKYSGFYECRTDKAASVSVKYYRVLEPVADAKPSYELNDLLSQITTENRHEEWPPYTEDQVTVTANDIRWQPDKVIDLLANLTRRVNSLERQLADTQGNVERQGVEIAELKHLAESNEEDIRTLDERTQPKRCEMGPTTDETTVFDLAKIKTFKLSDLAGKTLRIHSATDTAVGISVTTTVAIDGSDGKMYVLESEVVRP